MPTAQVRIQDETVMQMEHWQLESKHLYWKTGAQMRICNSGQCLGKAFIYIYTQVLLKS